MLYMVIHKWYYIGVKGKSPQDKSKVLLSKRKEVHTMRSYTNNDERTAVIRNLYNGDEFTARFPMDEEELNATADRASCHGSHDYIVVNVEGFYNFVYSEFTSIGELNDIAERIEALEDEDYEKFKAMAEYCDNLDDIERSWTNSCFYADTTLADYAELHAEECGFLETVPDFIRGYIDWEDMAEDMKIDDGYSEINGGVLFVAK